MTVLVWTRSPTAQDVVALALSRSGVEVSLVNSRDAVAEALEKHTERFTLILGPSFSLEEAESLGCELAEQPLLASVVLIEDLTRPLPCRTIVVDVPTRILTLPLRVRPLLKAVREHAEAS
ncbi:MAG: hypothetical protein EP330_27560 [Deltaproteobacteria bacterium]|nr:MAG: hypothetical protein EP330_27560 [Deltaproteobacteria bacterium]